MHPKNLFYRNDKIFIQLFCFQILGMIIRLTHLVFLYNPTKLNPIKHFLQIFILFFAITSSTDIYWADSMYTVDSITWNFIGSATNTTYICYFHIFQHSKYPTKIWNKKIKPGLRLCLYCFWADKLCTILYTRTWVYIPTSNIIINMKQIKREVLVKHFIIKNK